MGKKKGQKKRQENQDGSAPAPEQQENSGPSGLGSSQSQASQQQSGVREEERSSDQCQVDVTSQSAAMQQSATAPAQSSSALSAETKIVGKGRSGGQTVQSAGTATLAEQSTSAVTKSSKKKQNGKSQETQAPAASAAASPSPSGVEGTVTDMEKLTLKTKSEASSQQVASAQPSTDKPAGTKSKGKGKSGAQLPQQTATGTVQEKAPTQSSETKAGGKGPKAKGQEIPKVAPSATPSTSTQQAGDTVAKNEKTKFIIPKRGGSICEDRIHTKINHDKDCVIGPFTIEVNYLPLKINKPQLKIYHYDVTFVPIKKSPLKKTQSAEKTPKSDPKMPKFLLRDALNEMRKRHFSDRSPAFDGMSNMYIAGRPLSKDTIRDTVSVFNAESGSSKECDVTIKLVRSDLNIAELFEHCKTGITSDTPQTIIQATDVALRSGLVKLTSAGRSFFSRPDDPKKLGGGMELWHGFYQSAIGAWRPYLNIDVANKAFPIAQPVLDYLTNEMRIPDSLLRQHGLDSREKGQLIKFLKGLKISYEMPIKGGTQKRVYRVSGLGDNAEVASFERDNQKVYVKVYFEREKKYKIVYEKLPLLECGNERSLIPIELCSIVGNQAVQRKLDEFQTAQMVRAAARPPYERKSRIVQNIRNAAYARNPTLDEFGLEVITEFEKVDAVIIKPPDIAYRQAQVPVRDGSWKFNGNFLNPFTMPSWGILNLNQSSSNMPNFVKLMKSVGVELGMDVRDPQHLVNHVGRPATDKQVEEYLKQFLMKGIGLVVVVLANASENYGLVKRAAELEVGVLTQCLKFKTLDKINPTTVKNILLKVNAKLTGVNHCIAPNKTPALLSKMFMLVGADVTHPSPGPGATDTPSIAAVAASQDRYGFQYRMKYRLQPSRQEMITELADMMREHLESFREKWKRLPENIFYFRDGVSEGQFLQVLQTELVAIQRAYAMVQSGSETKVEARVLFLVVQKRHHTRFFPTNSKFSDKNGNVLAGTLVDHTITHPTEFDFFLVSHQSIQGTARPTKYHLLFDNLDYSKFPNIREPQFELEKLTYYLCHMFARCTRSVSYPAPTYYAHLAAFRARAWWDRMSPRMNNLAADQNNRGEICARILEKYPMFFT